MINNPCKIRTGIFNKKFGVVLTRLLWETQTISYVDFNGEIIMVCPGFTKDAIYQRIEHLKSVAVNKPWTLFHGIKETTYDRKFVFDHADIYGQILNLPHECADDIEVTTEQELFLLDWVLGLNEDELISIYGNKYQELKEKIVGQSNDPFITERNRLCFEELKNSVKFFALRKCSPEIVEIIEKYTKVD